ncbi:hypothetical protein [Thermococcus camini]|uniref:Uncharacterized protein n=1 Tax=Thermococcus camini TaxID=2016373 RepID=A0A7G2D6Z9_9EURY|nr:hypothetical protein [Thermococcus camini]CAD5243407.1 conserved exported protein of unknown function [Thermococcus camini]
MRRRGQMFSLDAMLSLVMVVMILGMVSTTSTALKGEITTMVGWYERSNVGDDILDILVKTPGDPEDWEADPSTLIHLGLENPSYPDTIDFKKVEALNNAYLDNDDALKGALINLSMGRDFSLGLFLTKIEISGDVTVIPPNTEGSVDVEAESQVSISQTNGFAFGRPVIAEWMNPERSDEEGTGNIDHVINITAGESFVFKLTSDNTNVRVIVHEPGSGQPSRYDIPSGVVVHIDVDTGYLLIGWTKLSDGTYKIWIPYKPGNPVWTTWSGTIWWGQQGGVSSSDLNIRYVYATEVTHADYNITLINGEFVNDADEIKASMDRSPWVTYSERRVPISKLVYSSQYTVAPSSLPEELYVGTIYNPIPEYMSLKVQFDNPGYIVMVAWLRGTNVSGYSVMAAYRGQSDPIMRAIINQTINGNTIVKYYSSQSPDYIIIPWKDFLTTIKPGENLDVYVWVYKMSNVDSLTVTDLSGLNTLMKPQTSLAVLRLRVWDEP